MTLTLKALKYIQSFLLRAFGSDLHTFGFPSAHGSPEERGLKPGKMVQSTLGVKREGKYAINSILELLGAFKT